MTNESGEDSQVPQLALGRAKLQVARGPIA